jgi:hypothetical protein
MSICVVNCTSAVLADLSILFESTTILHQRAYSLAVKMARELEGGGTDDQKFAA